jgi:hypothetical protein
MICHHVLLFSDSNICTYVSIYIYVCVCVYIFEVAPIQQVHTYDIASNLLEPSLSPNTPASVPYCIPYKYIGPHDIIYNTTPLYHKILYSAGLCYLLSVFV